MTTKAPVMTFKERILLNIPEPKDCYKSEVIMYKNNKGRVNYWTKGLKSEDFDIISYYLNIEKDEIKVLDEQGVYKIIHY